MVEGFKELVNKLKKSRVSTGSFSKEFEDIRKIFVSKSNEEIDTLC